MIDICEKCRKRAPIRGERYCVRCRGDRIRELEKSGYLRPVPKLGTRSYRGPGHREYNDTADGDAGPWSENAVRSLEG